MRLVRGAFGNSPNAMCGFRRQACRRSAAAHADGISTRTARVACEIPFAAYTAFHSNNSSLRSRSGARKQPCPWPRSTRNVAFGARVTM
jgi:hypothetical protein